jgi:hypothetical protein
MSRLTLAQLALANFKQLIPPGERGYCSREKALERLKRWTGQDFGDDIRAWEKWVRAYPYIVRASLRKDDGGGKPKEGGDDPD